MKIKTTAKVDGGMGENTKMSLEWSANVTVGDVIPVLESGHYV